MAWQMQNTVLWFYALMGLILAGPGAIISNLHWLMYLLGEPAAGTVWLKWQNKVEEVGAGWDGYGRLILFCVAVGFWGQINMALAGYQRRRGVIYTLTGMKVDEVTRRSLWGRLRVESKNAV
jgi:hypothetical protein